MSEPKKSCEFKVANGYPKLGMAVAFNSSYGGRPENGRSAGKKEKGKTVMNALPKLSDIDFFGGLFLGLLTTVTVLAVMTTTFAGVA